MAKVIPLRGIVYNPDKVENLADVTTPPYDVISRKEQKQAYACHPNNVIRLILAKESANDTENDNRYTRAASCCSLWCDDNILIRDQKHTIYFTSVRFELDGETITRYGFIARVYLEPFEKKVVLPHEKTFSKVRSDRLELMKACHINFSPVFALYQDGDNILTTLKNATNGKSPDMDFIDTNGHRQTLWRITDPVVHGFIESAMKNKKIFIADGHHRYETALDYRDWVRRNNPDFSSDHPANYIMMSLTSMEDPGLVILPAHRMLKQVDNKILDEFIPKADEYFDIWPMPFEQDNIKAAAGKLAKKLKDGDGFHTIGFMMKTSPDLYIMRLKPNVMDGLFKDDIPEALRNIDVTVLTHLVFMKILGFDQARLDNEKLIGYSSIIEKAIQGVLDGECDITFILNPTKIGQVRKIAHEGLIMPRKSTYFYPKVITGQVMSPLK